VDRDGYSWLLAEDWRATVTAVSRASATLTIPPSPWQDRVAAHAA
jgi:hypothetical protein